ncbi:MAG TPA: glycosyltransferase family 4 protein [Nitrospira sp.]|nr:glycosyltransferase family 4 protein [Nitrospira sp.]
MARRILYIHGIGRIGGAERDLLGILPALDRHHWEPHVACPSDTPLFERLTKEGIPLYPLMLRPWRKWYSSFFRWREVRKLRALITRVSPALIHVNDIWWVPHTVGAVSTTAGLRRPVVAHVRQEIEADKVRRYGLDSADMVVAISRQVEQALIAGGVARGSVQTVYSGLQWSNGVPATERTALCRTLGLPVDAVLLGTVAHLFPRKGYDVMLRALPRIIQDVARVHYLIVGTGDDAYERQLKTLADQLGIADHVHFVGFQDDVAPFLSALSLYVHPARMEGFGIAVVEALAAGKAVVATKVGGLPEVVDHETTGLLVAPDCPEELSAAILSLLRDDARRNTMGQRAAQAARERFDLTASVSALQQLYVQALNRSRERE